MIFNFINSIKNFFKGHQESGSTETRKNVRPENSANIHQKNFADSTPSDFIERKKQSMSDSQGVSDFSGSAYNGPGNVDREKTNSNMSQRNF